MATRVTDGAVSRAATLVSRVSRFRRSRALALPLLNLNKKRDCSQSNSYQRSEDTDRHHNWLAFSLSRLEYLFFEIDSQIFSTQISKFWLVFFFRSWTYILQISTRFLLHLMYFTSFDLSIMFSTCFYYRYNFVRNWTRYCLVKHFSCLFIFIFRWPLLLCNVFHLPFCTWRRPLPPLHLTRFLLRP